MALTLAALTLLALCAFCLAFACVGNLILHGLRFQMASGLEHLLLAVALGLLTTEILLFFVELSQHIRSGCVVVIAFLSITTLWQRGPVLAKLHFALRSARQIFIDSKIVVLAIALVTVSEFLCAMAPLTGSDALHYHFAVQKLILRQGFHPLFENSHSFLCGQHHLLILFGLGLGSERLALGFIFLGGILTATSLACLASRWAAPKLALTFSLLFLLTPVVFWQISASGAPDIFMAFLACLGAVVLIQDKRSWPQIALTGFLVGGIAGAKYTGCLIAAAFLMVIALEFRSLMYSLLFIAASLSSGIWPYVRNFLWTGDPVFPFLSAKLAPHLVTAVGLTDLARDTGASSTHPLSQLLPFVFLAAARTSNPGFWDFFGPTVFALAPLILLAFTLTHTWRIPLLLWFLSGIGIFYFSGLARFLLPLFPIALSCVAAGCQASRLRNLKVVNAAATALILAMATLGAVGLLLYSRNPILAATGVMSRTDYLSQFAPDYQIAEAINQNLADIAQQKALVFIPHMYYLDLPYLNGDPTTGFAVDPDRLKTASDWKRFFHENRIGFVVRAPFYPDAIVQPLRKMELEGDLRPFSALEVQNFRGNRMDAVRATVPVTILQVQP